MSTAMQMASVCPDPKEIKDLKARIANLEELAKLQSYGWAQQQPPSNPYQRGVYPWGQWTYGGTTTGATPVWGSSGGTWQ